MPPTVINQTSGTFGMHGDTTPGDATPGDTTSGDTTADDVFDLTVSGTGFESYVDLMVTGAVVDREAQTVTEARVEVINSGGVNFTLEFWDTLDAGRSYDLVYYVDNDTNFGCQDAEDTVWHRAKVGNVTICSTSS
jgi:hypothetical protein